MSSLSRMSVPLSWGPAQQAGTAGESWSSARRGFAVDRTWSSMQASSGLQSQDLESGPQKSDFRAFFVPSQGKALSFLPHRRSRCQAAGGKQSQEGSGGEQEPLLCSSRGCLSTQASVHPGGHPHRWPSTRVAIHAGSAPAPGEATRN